VLKTLNENTAVSVGLMGVLISLSVFVNTIYVENRQQAIEIERLHALIQADSKLKWQHITDLNERLSRIEGRIGKIEKWCGEILEDIRERRAKKP
jgi:hypothetical protein